MADQSELIEQNIPAGGAPIPSSKVEDGGAGGGELLSVSAPNGNLGRRLHGAGQSTMFRGLISSKEAGSIIGKGGNNINRLRKQYEANVQVPVSGTDERVLSISADVSSICDVIRDILSIMWYEQGTDSCLLKMLIHNNLAGHVIGKRGATITSLREKTGAVINVHNEVLPNSTERLVEVKGASEAIVNCVNEVLTIVVQGLPVKGVSLDYDPSRNINSSQWPKRPRQAMPGDGILGERPMLNFPSFTPSGQMPRSNIAMTGKQPKTLFDSVDKGLGNAISMSDIVEMRALVNGKQAGVIIGREGGNVSRMRKEHGANIQVPASGSDMRVLSIIARIDSVCNVLREILPACCEMGTGTYEFLLLIHYNLVGNVIGKGGKKITALRELTKAEINVGNEHLPESTDRPIWLHGNLEAVITCVRDIVTNANTGTPVKGPNVEYDPRKNSVSDPKALFSSVECTSGLSSSPKPLFDNATNAKRQKLVSMESDSTPVRYSGSLLDDPCVDQYENISSDTSQLFMSGGPSPQIRSLLSDNCEVDEVEDCFEGLQKTELGVPNKFVGNIIGRGGERIQFIRIKSGAQIHIADKTPESEKRDVVITGTREQIEAARLLMKEAARMLI